MGKASPKRAEAYRIYMDSGGTIRPVDLAKQLGVSSALVRKWKSVGKWERDVTQATGRKPPTNEEHDITKKIKAKLLADVGSNNKLNEKQRLFCLHYANSHNATQSYLKVYGGNKHIAAINGSRLLSKDKIKAEVRRLRGIMRAELDISVTDMLQYCMRIVGADIGDYISFGQREQQIMCMYGPIVDKKTKKPVIETVNYVDVNQSDGLDTSLIDEVKQGKDGISIKLSDKRWAWEQLAKYLGFDEELELKKAKLKAELTTMTDTDAEGVTIVDDIPDEECDTEK